MGKHRFLPLTLLAATLLAAAAEEPQDACQALQGEHQMVGSVVGIDHSKGLLFLVTDITTLVLHFPPAALDGVESGDEIRVQLAYRREC